MELAPTPLAEIAARRTVMPASHEPRFEDRRLDARLLRLLIAIAGSLVCVSSMVMPAWTVALAADCEGGNTVTEMLRGDYSPIYEEPDARTTGAAAEMTVAEMLRGNLSPIYAESEVAGVAVRSAPLTVEEMLRGSLSPIS